MYLFNFWVYLIPLAFEDIQLVNFNIKQISVFNEKGTNAKTIIRRVINE